MTTWKWLRPVKRRDEEGRVREAVRVPENASLAKVLFTRRSSGR
ncbi:hypothetical protein SH661x_001617 [Planctomicrobium sp. SH661]